MKIVKEQLDDVKSAQLYSDFDYSVNFVEYDTADSKEIEIVANHGKDTVNIINQVNSDLELDISENEIFAEPDKTYQKITDEFIPEKNLRALIICVVIAVLAPVAAA